MAKQPRRARRPQNRDTVGVDPTTGRLFTAGLVQIVDAG